MIGAKILPPLIFIFVIHIENGGNFARASYYKTFNLVNSGDHYLITYSKDHNLRSCLECVTMMVGKMRDLQGFGCGSHSSCFYIPRCLNLRKSPQIIRASSLQKVYVKSGHVQTTSEYLTNLALGKSNIKFLRIFVDYHFVFIILFYCQFTQ